jgi:hypothetical protein
VIHGDRAWQPSQVSEALEHSLHSRCSRRGVDLDRHAFARAIVNDREAAQTSPIAKPSLTKSIDQL